MFMVPMFILSLLFATKSIFLYILIFSVLMSSVIVERPVSGVSLITSLRTVFVHMMALRHQQKTDLWGEREKKMDGKPHVWEAERQT